MKIDHDRLHEVIETYKSEPDSTSILGIEELRDSLFECRGPARLLAHTMISYIEEPNSVKIASLCAVFFHLGEIYGLMQRRASILEELFRTEKDV